MSEALRAARIPPFEAIPGLLHGFEQRAGPGESREAGRLRVASALRPHGRLFLLRQVHGTGVLEAPWEGTPDGDAGIAAQPGVLVGVETADCLPILLVDPVGRLAAAVHAGWRGTLAGIARRAVSRLVEAGSRVEGILAGLGPGIGPCCYEVGEELRAAFGPDGARFFKPGPRGRPHLDVRAMNVSQLEESGVSGDRIAHVAMCTFCHAGLYHSFRRTGTHAGRMINYVGFSV